MKFGEQLRSSVIKEYEYYYIEYDLLKHQLKAAYVTPPTASNPKPKKKKWTEDHETTFIKTLDEEIKKVYGKQQTKIGEVKRRIASANREVEDLIGKLRNRAPRGVQAQEEDGPSEEDFMLLEEVLSDIIADVHDLAKFVQLNYTGFQKIVKKHDKITGWGLKPVFAIQLRKYPFFKDNYDEDIVKLSRLYDLVRTRGNPAVGDSAAGGSQANFIRNTTKYWVHPDNITELKLIILKHLPVLVFNASKEFEAKDSAITSIYYDNPETWTLYEGRLKKSEGAEAIRLRWYGGMETEQIFVERKTHREDWTGEKSVKARFGIKEKNVNAFVRGDMLPEAIFEKARKDGKKTPQQIDEDERLAREVQYSVLKNGYKPVCRSFYNRTAFQLPADARVRISLDTELTMVREDNLDGRKRSGDNWRRMDIGINYPFSDLPAEDVERFPYAVLEVKLQTQSGQEPPAWVRELISSHLVEAVPKFSKFIHGTATLFPTRIHLLPFWMPQMDVDIRKPVTQHFGIQRPGHSINGSLSDDDDDDDATDDDDFSYDQSPTSSDSQVNRLRRARDQLAERDWSARAITSGDVEGQTVDTPGLDDDYPLYDSDDDEDVPQNAQLEEARRVGGMTYYAALMKAYARTASELAMKGIKASSPVPKPTPIEQSDVATAALRGKVENKRFKAPKGKKIHVPVRVEPKVYFAAERTFLSWFEFSIYLSAIAGTLINFPSSTASSAKPSKTSFLVSGIFTLVAIFALLYSVGIYLYRSQAIRERRAIKYHDKWGPSALCVALGLAVVGNAGVELGRRW